MGLQPNSGAGKDRYIKQLERLNGELTSRMSLLNAGSEMDRKRAQRAEDENKKLLEMIKDLSTMMGRK